MMRGYLKIPGHNYSLDADVVSVGKGRDSLLIPPAKFRNAGAHIPIWMGKADPHHAIVEKETENNSYYLTDLNTAYGTYVNEKRIQNEKIKLTHGDRIRFGRGGMVHEFGLLHEKKQNSSGGQSGSVDELRIKQGGFRDELRNKESSSSSLLLNTIGISELVRPDTAPDDKYRCSNGVLRVLYSERAKSVPTNFRMMNEVRIEDEDEDTPMGYASTRDTLVSTTSSLLSPGRDNLNSTPPAVCTEDVWMLERQRMLESSEHDAAGKHESVEKEPLPSEPWYVSMLREKEQRLLQMGDELSKFALAEDEGKKKDEMINELRHKIAHMEMATASMSNNREVAEKNNQILRLGDQINGLLVYQEECERKDILINSLQEQVAKLEVEREELMKNLEIADLKRPITPASQASGISEEWKSPSENRSALLVDQFQGNLADIDISLKQSRDELDEFRKQLKLPIPDRRSHQEVVVELVSEIEQKQTLISQLELELKEAKHERNLSDGLTVSLQREVVRGQQAISKLTTSLEKAQKETNEAVSKAKAMSNKFANLKEEIKHEEVLAAMERSYCETQERVKDFQQQISKLQQKYDKQSKELRRANRQTKQHLEKGKFLQSQAEELQAEILELKQQEQKSRVLSEHTTARLERLRSKIIQAVYTAPGAIKPDSKLTDSDILNAVQKLINDRSDFHQQLCDLGQQMPPLVTVLDIQSEDSSDVEVPPAPVEKKSIKGSKKSPKK